ncbi:MAG: hypothetical protein Kow0042_15980 [Calditrichia bacterium]
MVKNSRPFILLALFLILYITHIFAQQNWIPLTPGSNNPTSPQVEAVSSDLSGLILKFKIPGISTSEKIVNGGSYTMINIPSGGHTADIGHPEVPTIGRYIAVPQGAEVSVRVTSKQSQIIKNVTVYPAQEPLPDISDFDETSIPFVKNERVYNTNAFFPDNYVKIDQPKIIRGLGVSLVVIFPVRYNPVTRELEVCSEIDVQVDFIGGSGRVVEDRYRTYHFDQLFQNLVLNYDILENFPGEFSAIDYLIITHDDYFNNIQPLANWKNMKGYSTKVLRVPTDVAATTSAIKSAIQFYYNTYGTEFVLLVGDADKIPTWYVTTHPYHGTKTATDLYYATVQGNDIYPDIFIGRLPIDAGSVNTVVQKILNYEKTPYIGSTSWYTRPLIAGYFQDTYSPYGYADRFFLQTSETIRSFLGGLGYDSLNYVYTTNCTAPKPWHYYYGGLVPNWLNFVSPGTNNIINAINNGVFLVQHRDHGSINGWSDPSFHSSNISSLTNGSKLPVVFSVNCQTGWFDYSSDSFCETFLEKSNGGCVAIVGATRVSYSGYNDELTKGFYDAIWPSFDPSYPTLSSTNPLLNSPYYKMGIVLNFGKFWMYDKYVLTGGSGYPWTPTTIITTTEFEMFHLFGCPEMELYTNVPSPLTVTHPSSITPPTSVTITVKSGTTPVSGALVCLYKTAEVYSRGYTDLNGQVILTVPTTSIGSMNVTVTHHNFIPYQGIIQCGLATVDALIWSPPAVTDSSAHAIRDALAANGKTAQIEPDLTGINLSNYDYVFVCLGVYPHNHVLGVGDPEVTLLENYLNSGGRLYMEGADTWAYDPVTSLHPYFKISGVSDGFGDMNIVLGSSCLEGMNFLYSGQNNYMDRLAPLDTALIFHKNDNPFYNCGIAYDYMGGAYRTIGTSFEFGGLEDVSASSFTKADLMASYLNFFDNGCNWIPPAPKNLYAYDGYQASVPLAWDPPDGYSPLDSKTEAESHSPSSTEQTTKENKKPPRINPLRDYSENTEQTLLSYNVYRSDSPGGPYTLLANVNRQYYRDNTALNGQTYYYVIKAVYDTGLSNFSNEDSATPMDGGYYIQAGWATNPPTLDGVINLSEWLTAEVVDITYPGVTTPVTLYVMNDDGHLYLAVDDPGNLTLDEYDQIGPYFDENHDREWPSASPSPEGNFWIEYLSSGATTDYRGISGWWPANLVFDSPVSALGVSQAISTTSGHVQYEADIDLTSSELNASPGDVIGLRLYSLIQPENIYSGYWPQQLALSPFVNDWALPAAYGDLELAVGYPAPQNLYAFNGYHGAIPLAWEAPPGFAPLDTYPDGEESSVQSASKKEKVTPEGGQIDRSSDVAQNPADQTLLHYDIYRSNTPGGPYALIATNVTRQYYRDESVSNGVTYYYVVKAIYDTGESNYSNESSGQAEEYGYYIHSGWTLAPPVLDGYIDPVEWSSADVVDMTYPGITDSVTLWVMNDGTHLYLAVDDPGNLTLDDWDQIGPYFDEDRNREWPMGSPSGEGNFWIEYFTSGSSSKYRGIYGWWPANIGFDSPTTALGVNQSISNTSGHVQYEVAIDLANSELNAAPGDVIGYRMYALIEPSYIYSGYWPQEIALCPWTTAWSLPVVYGDLELAPGAGYDWAAGLKVMDNCNYQTTLIFGTAPDATNGYDPLYDQYAPPPPPPGAFDARFTIGGEDFLKDFRATIQEDPIIWTVKFMPSAGCNPMTLQWYPDSLPPEGNFKMIDPFTGGNLVNINMRSQNSFTDLMNLGQVQIVYSLTQEFYQTYASGWNLLGLPFQVENAHYQVLHPDVIPNTCFGWNGTYVASDTLEFSKGYWLKFASAGGDTIEGTPVDTITWSLMADWNMISGGANGPIPLSAINDPGGIIVPGTLFGFNGVYYAADTIKQGEGYWIKASSPGLISGTPINLPKIALAKTGNSPGDALLTPQELEQFTAIELRDAVGRSQTLYLNVRLPDPEMRNYYQLPPLPPAGAFDARFEGDFRIAEGGEATILLQCGSYPVSLEIRNLHTEGGFQYVVEEILAGKIERTITVKEGEAIQITNPQIKTLRIKKMENVPLEFAVHQNYPNPFNPTTEIHYALPVDQHVEIAIYNILGQRVKTLISGKMKAGRHVTTWDATNEEGHRMASGVYFYAVKAGQNYTIKKMVLLK